MKLEGDEIMETCTGHPTPHTTAGVNVYSSGRYDATPVAGASLQEVGALLAFPAVSPELPGPTPFPLEDLQLETPHE